MRWHELQTLDRRIGAAQRGAQQGFEHRHHLVYGSLGKQRGAVFDQQRKPAVALGHLPAEIEFRLRQRDHMLAHGEARVAQIEARGILRAIARLHLKQRLKQRRLIGAAAAAEGLHHLGEGQILMRQRRAQRLMHLRHPVVEPLSRGDAIAQHQRVDEQADQRLAAGCAASGGGAAHGDIRLPADPVQQQLEHRQQQGERRGAQTLRHRRHLCRQRRGQIDHPRFRPAIRGGAVAWQLLRCDPGQLIPPIRGLRRRRGAVQPVGLAQQQGLIGCGQRRQIRRLTGSIGAIALRQFP